MAQVTELVTKFSFQGSLSPLNQFTGGLSKAIKGLGVYTVAVKATVGAVMAFAGAVLRSADAQVQLSSNTGVSIERIQELGYAASVSGSSTTALEQSMSGLTSSIGKAARQGSAEFSRLGISVRDVNGKIKNADQVLSEVSQRFKSLNISTAEQRTIAQSLGIDPSLVQMLNKTSGEMSALTQKARAFGIITSEQKKHITAFNDSVTTLRFGFTSIGRQIAIALAPIMTDIIKRFTDFLQVNQNLIKNGLEKLTKILFFVSEAVSRFVKVILNIIDAIGGWKNALILLGIAFLATPMGQFIAIITIIILIIDSLIVAFQGGDSAVRNFFLEFFGFDIVPVLKAIVSGFEWLLNRIGDVLSSVKEILIGVFTLDFDRVMSGINGIVDAIRDTVMGLVASIIKMLGDAFGFDPQPAIKKLVGFLMQAYEQIKVILDGLKDILVGVFTLDGDMIIGGFKKIFSALSNIILGLFDLWKSGWEKAVDALKGILSNIFDGLTAMMMKPVEAVKSLWNKVKGIFGGKDEPDDPGKPDNGGDKWKPEPGDGEETPDGWNGKPSTYASKMPDTYGDPSKRYGGGDTKVTNANTVQQNIDMKINSTDPIVAGQTAADGINQHLDDAENMNLIRNR